MMKEQRRILELVVAHAGAGVLAVAPATVLVALFSLTGEATGAGGTWWQASASVLVWALCAAVVVALLHLLTGGRPATAGWLSWAVIGSVVAALAVREASGDWPLAVVAAVLGAVAGAAADRFLVAAHGRAAQFFALAGLIVIAVAAVTDRMTDGVAALPRPRHIIVVCVDTLRADHISFEGDPRPTTPVLAELAAKEGVIFDTVYASSSWTLPSVASLMTSRHPPEHGAEDRGQRLPPGASTLAGRLSAAGWLTSGVVTHIYVSSLFGLDAGFLEFKELGIDWDFNEGRQPRADTVNQFVLPWLAHHADTPFFLYIHLFDPHWDYAPPPPFDRRFTEPGYPGPATGHWEYLQPYLPTDRLMAPADLRHVKDLYDGEIAWTDSQLGILFEALREIGLWDDTLLVVTSDHGEEFQEHGSMHHIRTLYEEVLRVPLLLKLPGGRPDWMRPRITERVRLIDVAPTILDLADAPPLEGARGQSLLPLLEVPGTDRPVFAHTIRHNSFKAALIRGHQKAIVSYPPGDERVEVFDLSKDPGEQAPSVLEPQSTTAMQLRNEVSSMLEGMYSERGSQYMQPVQLSEEQRQHLESLGYLE